jgi:hypothetical protein
VWYLLDTNVISASAPTKAVHEDLLRWMDANSDALFLSSVTVLEIEDGIAKLRREGSRRKAAALTAWLDAVIHLYAERILPLDVPVARLAGQLSDRARSRGCSPGFVDIAIAATALRHGLTVLTRNLRDFAPLNVPSHDPFAALPFRSGTCSN